MKNVVVIGGGTGLSHLLRGLKLIPNTALSAIVSVADDGGSSGRLTQDYVIPAVGDIRNVMVALSDVEPALEHMMNYRFDSIRPDLDKHNLGNLMITALMDKHRDFYQAIADLADVLRVRGQVLPAADQILTLQAKMQDGSVVTGESAITASALAIERVFYDHTPQANPAAVEAILAADTVILSMGSLYTSILPVMILPAIHCALLKTTADIVYVCNAVTQPGETDHYSVDDHVQALHRHLGANKIKTVLVNGTPIRADVQARYAIEQRTPVRYDEVPCDYTVVQGDLLDDLAAPLIRHDALKLALTLRKIIHYPQQH